MSSLIDQTAFSCYTRRSQWVVSSDHATRKVRGAQDMDCRTSSRLNLILKYDQAKEAKSAFCLLSVERQISSVEMPVLQDHYRFILWAFNHDKPSMLLPAMAMTR